MRDLNQDVIKARHPLHVNQFKSRDVRFSKCVLLLKLYYQPPFTRWIQSPVEHGASAAPQPRRRLRRLLPMRLWLIAVSFPDALFRFLPHINCFTSANFLQDNVKSRPD